jgi:hypothetical protein
MSKWHGASVALVWKASTSSGAAFGLNRLESSVEMPNSQSHKTKNQFKTEASPGQGYAADTYGALKS